MKICPKCKIKKDLSEFHKDKRRIDGYSYHCKECRKIYSKKYQEKNINKIRKYLKDNHDTILEKSKKYKLKNKERFKERDRKYYELNREIINVRHKKYQKENKDKRNDRLKIRLQTDPLFKLSKNMRNRIGIFLKSKNITKNNKTFDIIGCTSIELKKYIERQFTEGMSWNNYGKYGWHVDHKIPLDSGRTENEIYKLCYYTNLQPLWWKNNLIKSNKLL
jgi:hypothetical protein